MKNEDEGVRVRTPRCEGPEDVELLLSSRADEDAEIGLFYSMCRERVKKHRSIGGRTSWWSSLSSSSRRAGLVCSRLGDSVECCR